FLIVLLTGFVGLATMIAAAAVPVAVWFNGQPTPLFAFAMAMAVFLVWTHRGNIDRMRRGSEPHMTGLWLLRPRTPGS
ncbi:MAG: glycerol-3-phosphate acyltransferase, partial [Steroidobacteraceae bacterium]